MPENLGNDCENPVSETDFYFDIKWGELKNCFKRSVLVQKRRFRFLRRQIGYTVVSNERYSLCVQFWVSGEIYLQKVMPKHMIANWTVRLVGCWVLAIGLQKAKC